MRRPAPWIFILEEQEVAENLSPPRALALPLLYRKTVAAGNGPLHRCTTRRRTMSAYYEKSVSRVFPFCSLVLFLVSVAIATYVSA
jgi:hypothetical protein